MDAEIAANISGSTSSSAEPLRRKSTRVFEQWDDLGGRNRFFCRGHFISGPASDWLHVTGTCLFMIIPPAFFFVVCSTYLWVRVHWLIPASTVCLYGLCVIFIFLTSLTDPGILPRRKLQLAVSGLEDEVADSTGVAKLQVDPMTNDPIVDIPRHQENQGYRWCATCQVIRPPRASHCKHCDNCVLRMDHHCPFLSTCIGQRNYGYFIAFIICAGLLAIVMTSGIVLYVVDAEEQHPHPEVWLRDAPLHTLLIVLGLPTEVANGCLLGLGVFHVVLVCRGRTTREVLLSSENQGSTFFTRRGRSLIHAQAVIPSAKSDDR